MIWLKIAIRNMSKRRLRTVFTILGIAFGVALVFGVNTTKSSTLNGFVRLIDDIGGKTEFIVNANSGASFDSKITKEVATVKNVKLAVGSITGGVFLVKDNQKIPLEFLGIDPKVDQKIRNYDLAKGHFFKRSDKFALLMNADFAKQKGLGLGSKVALASAKGIKEFKIKGLLKSTGIGRSARGLIAIAPVEAAQDMFLMNGKVNQIGVIANKNGELNKIKRLIKEKLGSGYEVKMPASRGKALNSAVDFLIAGFNFFSYIVLLVGAFLVLNTLKMNVSERQFEIGVLRAIGSSRGQILGVILIEALVVGLIGVIVGVTFGWFLSLFLIKFFAIIFQAAAINVEFSMDSLVFSAGLGLIVVILAAFLPALKASHISPMQAISLSKRDRPSWFENKGWIFGFLLMIAAGLVYLQFSSADAFTFSGLFIFVATLFFAPMFVSFGYRLLSPIFNFIGVEGKMAVRNMERTRGRSTAGVIAVISSIILTLMIGELGISQNKTIKRFVDEIFSFDISLGRAPFSIIDINKYPAMPISVKSDIEKISGVDTAYPAKWLPVRGPDKDLFATFLQFRPPGLKVLKEGDAKEAFAKLRKGDHVIVSTTVAQKYKLHVGDNFRIKTPGGWRNFKVAGSIVDFGNNGEAITLGRKDLWRYWHVSSVDYFDISVKRGTSVSAVQDRLFKKIGKPRGITVISSAKQRADLIKISDQFSAAQQSLIVLAVLVSTLGIINILAMNVLERQREIGILRSIGFFRGQLRKSVILEAQAIGLIGAMLGIVVGLIMAKIVIIMGNKMSAYGYEFIFPINPLIASIIIAFGISLLAALYPANKAAKTNIVEALRYE